MRQPKYSPDFVDGLVHQVLSHAATLTETAHAHGIHPGVLSKWVKRQREGGSPQNERKPPHHTEEIQERLQRLEERIDTLSSLLGRLYQEKYSRFPP